MRLYVRAEAHTERIGAVLHELQVALENIEIEQQGWGWEIPETLVGQGVHASKVVAAPDFR